MYCRLPKLAGNPLKACHWEKCEQMNQTENFNTSWLSLKSLPILLYFGSILIMSTVFCAFRFFNRSKRSSKDAEKKKQNAANSDGHTSRFRSACRAVFFSCTRINLNKDNKYFVNKKNTEANDQKLTARAGKETTLNIPNASNDKLSKGKWLAPPLKLCLLILNQLFSLCQPQ